MDKFQVPKNSLIAIMRENRTKHLKIYEEATIKYKERAIKALTQQLALAKEDKKFSLNFTLVKPACFVEAYDDVIGLLEMSLSSTVELTHEEYKRYVKDQWNWAGLFASNSMSYVNKLAAVGSSDVAAEE